jgi:hypothetical protein
VAAAAVAVIVLLGGVAFAAVSARRPPPQRLAASPVATPAVTAPATPTPAPTPVNPYLTIAGRDFDYEGRAVTLRGVNFNNEPALECCGMSADIAKINVQQPEYSRLRDWGGNHVRWGMSYSWYAVDRARFFQVMDQHVELARRNRLWLIPVLYKDPSGGGDFNQPGLWSSGANQDKLVAFWTDVAQHYANEPVIAGYDMYNEPSPPSAGTWQALAQRIRDAIASVDPHHFVIYEATDRGGPLRLRGGNIVYSIHVYPPGGGPYPDVPRDAPLWVGEFGSKNDPGWVRGQIARYARDGVHWAFFVMREDPNDYGLYVGFESSGDFSHPYRAMIDVVTAGLAGSVTPYPPATPPNGAI